MQDVGHHQDIGYLADRCILVFVDGNDKVGFLHPCQMLDSPADAAGHIELGRNRLPGGAYLVAVLDPAGVHNRTTGSQFSPQGSCQGLDELERIQRFRAERGDISELELLRIQVQRFAFERDAADARQALRAAKIALRAAAGPDRIAEEFDLVGELAVTDIAPTQSDLYRRALANRPDLRAAEAASEKATADIRLARANAWWDVTPQVEYQRIGPDNTIGFGISVPIRIFDRNQGEIARTRAEAQRVAAAREAVAIQALSEVDTALVALRTAQQKLTVLRDTYLPKAKQARDTTEFAYRRGGVSLLDYLDAQRTYRDTAAEYLRTLGSYWTSFYQLETAVGGSLEK